MNRSVSANRPKDAQAVPPGNGWWRSLWELTWFSLIRNRVELPFYVILQVLVSCSVIFGLSIMADTSQPEWVSHLAAGSWAISLLMIGCVVAPSKMMSNMQDGVQTFLKSLPVPRSCLLFSDALVWTLACMPGFIGSVVLASLRFQLQISVTPLTLCFVALALFVYLMIGYAVAVWIPITLASLVTQVIILGALLFSPISYPADRIPDWAVTAHSILPFTPAANLVREGFFPGQGADPWNVAVVIAWSAVLFALSLRGVGRRS